MTNLFDPGVVRGRRRILVADDEAAIRHVVKDRLEREGFQVVVADDGQNALALAMEYPPHLIVSDYKMPVMDGLELAQHLAEHPFDGAHSHHPAHWLRLIRSEGAARRAKHRGDD